MILVKGNRMGPNTELDWFTRELEENDYKVNIDNSLKGVAITVNRKAEW